MSEPTFDARLLAELAEQRAAWASLAIGCPPAGALAFLSLGARLRPGAE